MLDLFHIPSNTDSTKIFYANSGSWQTWQKPRNAKFIQIVCLGGAGGGGGGRGLTGTSTVRGGGGGGASGGVTQGLFPAFLLPDILYIQPGVGGTGGPGGNQTGGTTGTVGSATIVGLSPSISVTSLICSAAGGNGGVAGGQASVAGGASTAAQTVANALFLTHALFTSYATVAGSTGAGVVGGAAGGSQTALNTAIVTGGAGGGTAGSGPGGSIAPATVILLSVVSGSATQINAAASIPGDNGYGSLKPLCGTGGGGGGGNTAFTGSAGGSGWYGCGGGGGAGGQNVGGRGGNGGDGLVIITTIT